MVNLENIIKEGIKRELQRVRKEVNINPSEKQKIAGNYKMGHININGFEITIENPKGSYRRGTDKDGKKWSIKMNNDYGYFVKTEGYDGDAIDCFIGPNIDSTKIYVVDQFISGSFDESKVMLGFDTLKDAKKAYFSNYNKDWKGFKNITGVSKKIFKEWLYDGYKQKKPFYQYKEIKETKLIENIIKESVREILKQY